MAINNCLLLTYLRKSSRIFLVCNYLLNQLLETRNKPYTNTILHNSPKGEPKWLRASHSHPLGLCSIAALAAFDKMIVLKNKQNE